MKVKRISIKNNGILTVFKGALNALIISLIGILLFAFIIKLTSLSDGLIKPINQIIKVISILFGCFIAFKKDGEKTVLKGGLIGLVYIVLAFVLFSLLNGSFEFSITILLDVLFGFVLGTICAMIHNLVRKK